MPLTPKAFNLLVVLVENRGRLIEKEELMNRVWPETYVEENNLTLNIHQIRKVLRNGRSREIYIETVPTRGYRFIADVDEIPIRKDAPTDAQTEPAHSVAAHVVRVESTLGTRAAPQQRASANRSRVVYTLLFVTVAVLSTVLALRLMRVSPLRITSYTKLTHDGREKGTAPLLTDGLAVYFRESDQGRPILSLVSVTGGETARVLPVPPGFSVWDVSPSRSELLMTGPVDNSSANQVWIGPLLGGSRRRVGDITAETASWSPDTRRIVYTREKSIYVAMSDGSDSHKIVTLSGYPGWLRWSPDGGTLRFSLISGSDGGGTTVQSLWEIAPDGTNLHLLLAGWNNPPRECCGNWTPDGRYFVFQSSRNDKTDLWAFREGKRLFEKAHHEPIQLTASLMNFTAPAPSKDGKKLFAVGEERRGELVRYDSHLRAFVPYLGGISATWATFSRDGQWLAYESYPDNILWRAKPDGSDKVQLTFPPLEAAGLSWSPDGRWIALRARTPGKPWKIYLVPAEGGNPRILTSRYSDEGIPSWSADGTRLAFGDVPQLFGRPTGTEAIHIYDLTLHQLSTVSGSEGLWTARWSPDGNYLSALTIEGRRLMLYNIATKKWRPLDVWHVNNPTWTTDAKYIYFDTEGNDIALRRVRVSDGKLEQLASLNGYSVAGGWSGLAPDNSPLILRNLGASEIYALDLELP